MGDVSGGVQVDVSGGQHSIELRCDTVDGRYHVGLYYVLDATITPWPLGCSACGSIVEWVRTSKRSKWRLHRGSDLLTCGRYVFAPEGTPHCPHPHNLGSRDWTSDERDPPPALGEYDGPTKYDNGALESPYPDARTIGSADCLENGETSGGSETVMFTRGYPLPCWDSTPTFPDVGSRSFKVLIAEAMVLHYAGDPTATDKLQEATGFASPVADYPVTTGLPPGGMIQVTPIGAFVLIDGTSDPQTLALQAAAALTPPTNLGPYSTFPGWATSALTWHLRLVTNGVDPTGPIYLCGHSMGGVLSGLLAARYIAWNPNRFIALQTFGSPCPGDARLVEMMRGVYQEQLANQGDWIPCCASWLGLGWPLVWAVTPLSEDVWPRWQQPIGRMVLAVDGSINPNTTGWYDMNDLLDAAFALANSNPTAAADAHRMAVYLERLRRPGS